MRVPAPPRPPPASSATIVSVQGLSYDSDFTSCRGQEGRFGFAGASLLPFEPSFSSCSTSAQLLGGCCAGWGLEEGHRPTLNGNQKRARLRGADNADT